MIRSEIMAETLAARLRIAREYTVPGSRRVSDTRNFPLQASRSGEGAANWP